jgi:hypothetical protein
MIYDVRKIKRINENGKIDGKIIKEDFEIKHFPTPGTKIKVKNKYEEIHSVDLIDKTDNPGNDIINVL